MTEREYTNEVMRSFFGARPGGQDRPQDVFTPQYLIDAILAIWPEGIALDPCAHPDSIVPAGHYYSANGETLPWVERTYVNPPYRYLLQWMHRFTRGHEYLLLAPLRGNRQRFVEGMRQSTRQCWLKPVKFLGYDQSFPAPLTMAYYGTRIEVFEKAMAPHGEIVSVL